MVFMRRIFVSRCLKYLRDADYTPKICFVDDNSTLELGLDTSSCNGIMRCEGNASVDKYLLFEKFSQSGLSRLGLQSLGEMYLREIWKEAEPFAVCYSLLALMVFN